MPIGIKDQYFGTEIEMTGITRRKAAEAVAELFGTHIENDGGYYGVWSVVDPDGKKWKFMYDGSIQTQRRVNGQMQWADSDYSTEMVSPRDGKTAGGCPVSQKTWSACQFVLWNARAYRCCEPYCP